MLESINDNKLNRKIDLLYDPLRSLYILSEKIENILLLMLREIDHDKKENNNVSELILFKAVCLFGEHSFEGKFRIFHM